MARIAWNWWSGMVVILDDSEVTALLNTWQGIDTAISQVIDPALSAVGVGGWKANLVKGMLKGIFMYRRWNIGLANRNRRGAYITLTWLLFAAVFVPNPISGPLPAVLFAATYNPLYVFIGPR